MNGPRHLVGSLVVLLVLGSLANAQRLTVVPRLVNFSGIATDAQGKAIAGVVGATFAIYKDQTQGAPLWIETQNVTAGTKGTWLNSVSPTQTACLWMSSALERPVG